MRIPLADVERVLTSGCALCSFSEESEIDELQSDVADGEGGPAERDEVKDIVGLCYTYTFKRQNPAVSCLRTVRIHLQLKFYIL